MHTDKVFIVITIQRDQKVKMAVLSVNIIVKYENRILKIFLCIFINFHFKDISF